MNNNNAHDISQIKLYHVKYFTAFANLTVQLNTPFTLYSANTQPNIIDLNSSCVS